MAHNPRHIAEIEKLLKREALVGASESARLLKISQPTFSRALKKIPHLLKFGHARQTRYALSRDNSNLPHEIPLYEITQTGKAELLGTLYPTEPQNHFVLSSKLSQPTFQSFRGLPYFFDTIKLSGFLGRLAAPLAFPDRSVPPRLDDWSDDDHLNYLLTQGWDQAGNLIVGKSSLDRFRTIQQSGRISIPERNREDRYTKIVRDIAQLGNAGSSAGGEQPKFTLCLSTPKRLRFVIVKYCDVKSAEGKRVRDLLIAEHLALVVLKKHGILCSQTQLIENKTHCFLEIERFDRVGEWGRAGHISIGLLNNEFVGGSAASWSDMAEGLHRKAIISKDEVSQIQKLDSFGRLISNTDRHMGNLSFFFDNLKVRGLSPVYDMLPMAYMPRNGQTFTPRPSFSPPTAGREDAWTWSYPIALEYWATVAAEQRISTEFRKIAKDSIVALKTLRESLIFD